MYEAFITWDSYIYLSRYAYNVFITDSPQIYVEGMHEQMISIMLSTY